MRLRQLILRVGQHQRDHQVDDLAGREVLARVLVERLVEATDELLEERAHLVVADRVGMEVDRREALQDQEQQARLIQLGDRVAEVEALQDLPHVRAEAGQVVTQVRGQVRRVGEEAPEVVAAGVVEGVPRGAAELVVTVLQAEVLELGVALEHRFLGRLQDAVDPAQHGEGQDHVLVLAALEVVAQQLRDAHRKLTRSAWVFIGGYFGSW